MKSFMVSTLCAALCTFTLSSCKKRDAETLTVATCADYPPFEYYAEDGSLQGFDIELAKLIARQLQRGISFQVVDFVSVLAALETGNADIGISTISVTPERKKQFHFSNSYYTQALCALRLKNTPQSFSEKIIGCQAGSTMEDWVKKHHGKERCITMDENTQLVEALKSGQVDVVVIDGHQAQAFCARNSGLTYENLGTAPSDYAIACAKGNALIQEINKALDFLKKSGELDALKRKYHLQ
jgi:polar amino acid transport system substrate-binding protein